MVIMWVALGGAKGAGPQGRRRGGARAGCRAGRRSGKLTQAEVSGLSRQAQGDVGCPMGKMDGGGKWRYWSWTRRTEDSSDSPKDVQSQLNSTIRSCVE